MSTSVASVIPLAPPSVISRVCKTLGTFARRSPMSFFWGCIALLIVLMAITAPWIAPVDPLRSNFRHMQNPPGEMFWFGTDQIGRDTLSRVIYGSQTSDRKSAV